jgi:glucose-6-phosphate 1-epimerase
VGKWNIDALQQQCSSVDGVKVVVGRGELPELHVENRFCRAIISLLGGQVLSYHRVGDEHPLLFCSQNAFFQQGKGIKGGAPVCWPWFGQSNRFSGAHGFARSALWNLDAVLADDCGVTQVDMSLPAEVIGQNAQWPYHAELKTSIRLGKWLSIELVTENLGSESIPLTQALHTYFNVGDISKVRISGLEHSSYLDNLEGLNRKPATGEIITFTGEVDRIYDEVSGVITLMDGSLNRTITIETQGSRSAIVWNPWVEKATAMADFADHEYLHMVCVETANAGGDERILPPKSTGVIAVEYKIEV